MTMTDQVPLGDRPPLIPDLLMIEFWSRHDDNQVVSLSHLVIFDTLLRAIPPGPDIVIDLLPRLWWRVVKTATSLRDRASIIPRMNVRVRPVFDETDDRWTNEARAHWETQIHRHYSEPATRWLQEWRPPDGSDPIEITYVDSPRAFEQLFPGVHAKVFTEGDAPS